MKFTIAPADLKEAVRFASTAIEARPTSPIMGGVMLTANNNELTASGSDYSRVASLSVPVDAATPGKMLLSAKVLGQAVAKFRSSKPVQVSLEGSKVKLAQGATKFSLHAMPAEEYPRDLVGTSEPIGRVNGEAFAHLIRNAGVSLAKDDKMPILQCARLDLGEKLEVQSTDRYRLSLGGIQWEPSKEMQLGLTVSGEWLRSVGKTVAGETELFVGYSDHGEANRFGVTSGAYSTSVSLTAGEYPKIRALFKNTEHAEAHTYDRQELLSALDAASVMLEGPADPVLFENRDGKTTISATGEGGESGSTIESSNGENFKIAFNPTWILEILRVTDSENITVAPNGPKAFWVTTDQGETDHLVMPVRLPETNAS